MNRVRIAGAAIAALMVATVSHGATHQVGAGQTFSTIQACEDAAVAGDICNIHAGTYTETVTVSVSNLTFQNHSGESPVVRGRFSVGSSSNVTITCNVGGGQMQITAFGSATEAWPGIHQIRGTGLTVTGCRIHTGYGPGVYSRGSTRLRIDGNAVHGNSNASSGPDADGITIISGQSTNGTYENGVTISNNVIYDNHVDGMKIHGQFFVISGNTVRDNIYSDWASTHPDGIQFNAGSADGYVSVQHAKVFNNVVKNHTQNIFLEGSARGQSSNCEDIWIWNNVLYSDGGTLHGVVLDSLGGKNLNIKYAKTVRVYNNTFGRWGGVSVSLTDSYNDSIIVKNNIIDNVLGAGINVPDAADVPPGGLDYNQYHAADFAVAWAGSIYSSRSAFHNAVGSQETRGLDGDPLLNPFPNPTLRAGSPAIGKGVNLSTSCSECATDKAGIARGSIWDLGAFESSSATDSPSAPSNLRILSH